MTGSAHKFLVIADGSPESRMAAYFAARRAARTGGRVTLFACVEPHDFHHWLGVGEQVRRESREEAQTLLLDLVDDVWVETGSPCEYVIREGDLREELMAYIEQDPEIRLLVLGAAAGSQPGPLVGAIARGGRGLFGARAVPVTVIPCTLSKEDLRALT